MKYFIAAMFWLLVTLPLFPIQTYKELEMIKAPQICLEANGEHYCADSQEALIWGIKQPDMIQTAKEAVKPRISQNLVPQGTIKGSISKYSLKDSCHNKVNGKCLMASGKPVFEGAVACPYNLKLGTKVEINGQIYVCSDRTAKWVQDKWPNAFDIFTFDYDSAVKHGRQVATVKIL